MIMFLSWAVPRDPTTGVSLIRLQSPTEDCPDRTPLSAVLAGIITHKLTRSLA